jgi:hypothetical protein
MENTHKTYNNASMQRNQWYNLFVSETFPINRQ